MFKCWIYISGENISANSTDGLVSDKDEVYKSKSVRETEDKKINSYVPDMRTFSFFNRIGL
jgi:hypothetical protein